MRLASLFGFGAALVCAALLVACGGGGGGSSPVAGGSLSGGDHSANAQSTGTRVTIVINRTPGKAHTQSTPRRGAQASRRPKYLSTNAAGLQLTVSASGVASQTVYADVSGSSPLCTTSSSIETCVITVPTLAASEQFSALETDSLPNSESAGYGTGFPTGSNILGAINASETVQLGGANAIGLELGPVTGHFYDCSGNQAPPASLPQPYGTNFGIDQSTRNDDNYAIGSRIVVTGGVAVTGSMATEFCDPAGGYDDYDSTPAPFVDVNGSPTPITLTSNSSGLTLAPIVNNGTAPPTSAYAQTASIANDSYEWYDCVFEIGVKTSASFTAPATIVVNNNLTAINPFTSSNYASAMTYTVVPITVSPTTATVSASGGTATVTGSDNSATSGMQATSSYAADGDGYCMDSNSNILATVAQTASINTTNWTQSFQITGNSNGTGTCTFYLQDVNAGTVTQVVTVTVN